MERERKRNVAVVGSGGGLDRTTEELAEALGAELVGRGFRVVTGGLGGVMEAAARGASQAGAGPGDVVAIVPGHSAEVAHEWASVVIPTGLGFYRNGVVAHSDALVAVGGGAGTLSEIALAWKLDRLVVAMTGEGVEGWSTKLAGTTIDARTREVGVEDDRCYPATTASEAVDLLVDLLPSYLSSAADGLQSAGKSL